MLNRLKFLSLMLVALLSLNGASFAQGFTEKELPPLSYEAEMTQKEFILQTKRIEKVPAGDESLKYRVRLPEGWMALSDRASEAIDLNDRLLGVIAKYVSPPLGDKRAQFVIRARELDYLISTKNWLLNYVNEQGYTLNGISEVHKNRVEAAYIVFKDGVSYGVRAVIEKKGARILLAEYYAPAGYVASSSDMQTWVTRTFRFLEKGSAETVPLKEYEILDFASYFYPEDWDIVTVGDKTPQLTQARLTKSVLSDEDKKRQSRGIAVGEKGIIQTYLVSKESLDEQNIEDFLNERLIAKNMMYEKETLTKRNNNMFGAKVENEIYRLKITNGNYVDYEFWVTVQDAPRHKFITTLVTPTRDFSFLDWAKNSGTYDLITATFRPATYAE